VSVICKMDTEGGDTSEEELCRVYYMG